jgi:hypothetical protein
MLAHSIERHGWCISLRDATPICEAAGVSGPNSMR